ncbi:E3 ubiquitin-protein ligase CCNB1IP1-like isoform X2 [Mizuhopecten yessoensis]|uniref:E3 ubiquitin-protein ligase CCNB1IP1-like isoform X2 n=1 Tax=Mizuhopecten yessoensis TaxID=6573 RepID=UPI000B45E54F|nr:E3 ubiquitin-protein ligase CCNB1IP1-like isoform X2 [Mizuhopecten yessoensis]
MDGELICNYKKCRKRLNSFAWVTSCSHIFCDEDGAKEFNKSYTCPACENTLSGKFDIIRIDLQPNEQYKSMVLAGQKPETIMEICTRALSFWTYQAHQERTYQEYVATKAKERAVQLEQYYEQIVSRTQTELTSLKTQLSASKKELDTTKKKHNEIAEKLLERNRQYQKLQGNSGDGTPSLGSTDRKRTTGQSFTMPLSSGDDILRQQSHGHHNQQRKHTNSPPEREFVLRPNSTPTVGDLSNHAEAGTSRFNLTFHTPR